MTTFYIAPNGSDSHDGLLPEAGDGNCGPFASLARARDAVRVVLQAQPGTAVQVELRGGTYFLDESFELSAADSGTPDAPVVYRAYANEVPIISGGRRITGFEETDINGNTGWVADVPGDWSFSQLFVNGFRTYRTRLPEQGFFRIEDCEKLATSHDWLSDVSSFVYAEGDLDAGWRNLADVEVLVPRLWYESHTNIASIASDTRRVQLDTYMIGGGREADGSTAHYWVENVFEAMNKAGQFYHDRAAGKLYILPRFGDRLPTAEVIAPRLQTLMRIEGDPFGEKAAHIRFENIQFKHAEYRYPAGDPGPVQGAFTLPGALEFIGAEACVLYGCEISQVAQYAIEFGLGCTQNRVVACHIHDMGGGGIKIYHDRGYLPLHEDAVRGKTDGTYKGKPVDPEAAADLPPKRTLVSDCEIHDGGIIFSSAVGIWIGDSAGNRIRHNTIHRMNYSGISCGWSWVYEYDVYCADNLIEYNHIHHLNPHGLLSDLAGIYTLGSSPGTVLRGNLIHDIQTAVYGNWGIYHDASSSYHFTEHNAAFRCGYGAFFSNAGKNNTMRRNILVNDLSPDNPALAFNDCSGLLSQTVEETIFASPAPQITNLVGGQEHIRFKRNIFMGMDGRVGFFRRVGEELPMWSLDAWCEAGIGQADRVAPWSLQVTEDGAVRVIGEPEWLDAEWRQVLRNLRSAGPRGVEALPRSFDNWPLDRETESPAAVLMPVWQLDVPMIADEIKQFYKQRFCVDAQGRVSGHLELINRGEVPVCGRVAFAFEEPDAGTVEAETTTFELGVRERVRLPFTVTLKPDTKRALLMATLAEGDGFHPVGIFLYAESEAVPEPTDRPL